VDLYSSVQQIAAILPPASEDLHRTTFHIFVCRLQLVELCSKREANVALKAALAASFHI